MDRLPSTPWASLGLDMDRAFYAGGPLISGTIDT